jgi:hypothetical protein
MKEEQPGGCQLPGSHRRQRKVKFRPKPGVAAEAECVTEEK